VTEGTVKLHLSHIFPKLGVSGRVAAVGAALQRGLAILTGPGPLSAESAKKKSPRSAA
jgi:hypothetical protein